VGLRADRRARPDLRRSAAQAGSPHPRIRLAGSRGVSDGTRTRGRRDHNPSNMVRLSAPSPRRARLSAPELLSVALNLDPAQDPATGQDVRLARYTTCRVRPRP
jgi:hypothetical protein